MDDNTRIAEYLTALYRIIWFTWFYGQENARPATVVVEFVDGDDGYDQDARRLTLRISEANGDDILKAMQAGFNHHLQPPEWPGWLTSLIHEMTHEYQFRILNDAISAEGQTLADHPQEKNWGGPGHGPGFYSAIANRASFMGVPALNLCTIL